VASETAPAPWVAAIPNLLTVLRILLAAALPFLPSTYWLAIVVAAGLSDLLDGIIARRFNATSELGALLDGIADKLFVLAAVVTLVGAGQLEWWQGLLVMSRDFTVGAMAGYSALRGEWPAFLRMHVRIFGKLTTAVVFPWLVVLLVEWGEPVRTPLFWLASAMSVIAALDYLGQFVRAHAGSGSED
jgi:cardiolipin synthase